MTNTDLVQATDNNLSAINGEVENDLPQLTNDEMDSGALIGVCGVQGAGKTVFLTAVFHSIDLALGSEGISLFDRKHRDGARQFDRVESEIRKKGVAPNTKEGIVARINVRQHINSDKLGHDELPVYLFDFAGKYFENFSSIGKMLQDGSVGASEKEKLKLVNTYLERCDGFILLVDSGLLTLESKQESAFPASVIYLMSYCRKHKKPLALVLTKADKHPSITVQSIERLERIKWFRECFTEDMAKAAAGHPFGTVNLIYCYKVDDKGCTVTPADCTSIWSEDPSRIFLSIFQTALPLIKDRLTKFHENLQGIRDQEGEKTLEDARKARQKKQFHGILAAAFLLLIVFGAIVIWNQKNSELDKEHLARLEKATIDVEKKRFLAAAEKLRTLPTLDPDAVSHYKSKNAQAFRMALSRFWSDYRQATERLLENPELGAEYKNELGQLESMFDLLPLSLRKWWQLEMSPILSPRLAYLSRDEAQTENLEIVNESMENYQKRDKIFYDLLVKKRAQLQKVHIEKRVNTVLESGSNLVERFRTIQVLASDTTGPDWPQYRLSLRGRLGQLVIVSIMQFEDNKVMTKLLRVLDKSVSDSGVATSRFELTYENIKSYSSAAMLQPMLSQIEYTKQEIGTLTAERRALAKSTLVEVFDKLDLAEKKIVWGEMIQAMSENNLFNQNPNSWVTDVVPTGAAFRRELEKGWCESRHNACVDNLAKDFIYKLEFDVLAALINKQNSRYIAVRVYRNLVTQLNNRPIKLATVELEKLANDLENMANNDLSYLKQTVDFFGSMLAQVETARISVVGFNMGKVTSNELQRILRKFVAAHCSNLAADSEDCNGVD